MLNISRAVQEKLVYGLVSYWPVAAGCGVYMKYFGLIPQEDGFTGRGLLFWTGLPFWLLLVMAWRGPSIRLGLSLLPLAMGGWAVVSSMDRFDEIYRSPDLNGDGIFSISDVPAATYDIVFDVGHQMAKTATESPGGKFFELRTSRFWFELWSIVMTIMTYVMTAIFLSTIWKIEPPKEETDQEKVP